MLKMEQNEPNDRLLSERLSLCKGKKDGKEIYYLELDYDAWPVALSLSTYPNCIAAYR
jgi:hypothetical protein